MVYPLSQHTPPQLWEWEQPSIGNLTLNARTFDRRVMQWYCENWQTLAHDNARMWKTYYRTKPLFDHLLTWEDWLPEYRQLIIEVQESADATGWRGPAGREPQAHHEHIIP